MGDFGGDGCSVGPNITRELTRLGVALGAAHVLEGTRTPADAVDALMGRPPRLNFAASTRPTPRRGRREATRVGGAAEPGLLPRTVSLAPARWFWCATWFSVPDRVLEVIPGTQNLGLAPRS